MRGGPSVLTNMIAELRSTLTPLEQQGWDAHQEAIQRARRVSDYAADLLFPGLSTARVFGGIGARTADLDALATAKKMARKGIPVRDIHASTGWFKGLDGEWRFEIPDSTMSLKGKHTEWQGREVRSLADAILHKRLFDAYPELGELPTRSYMSPFAPTEGLFMRQPAVGKIPASKFLDARSSNSGKLQDVLVHEIQHAIQDWEGFAQGGEPRLLGYDAYMNLPGEKEARYAASRRKLSGPARKRTPPIGIMK